VPARSSKKRRTARRSVVADVRHVPRSRTNPQFNREILPDELQSFQIGYIHLAALGGLRSRVLETSPNLLWQNSSFRNYADYAMTEEFHQGLTELRTLGHKRRSAIMCAEAVWWRCHRRIIADVLVSLGIEVVHIQDATHATPHRLAEPARLVAGQLRYEIG